MTYKRVVPPLPVALGQMARTSTTTDDDLVVIIFRNGSRLHVRRLTTEAEWVVDERLHDDLYERAPMHEGEERVNLCVWGDVKVGTETIHLGWDDDGPAYSRVQYFVFGPVVAIEAGHRSECVGVNTQIEML